MQKKKLHLFVILLGAVLCFINPDHSEAAPKSFGYKSQSDDSAAGNSKEIPFSPHSLSICNHDTTATEILYVTLTGNAAEVSDTEEETVAIYPGKCWNLTLPGKNPDDRIEVNWISDTGETVDFSIAAFRER